jgi:hypothetical protein
VDYGTVPPIHKCFLGATWPNLGYPFESCQMLLQAIGNVGTLWLQRESGLMWGLLRLVRKSTGMVAGYYLDVCKLLAVDGNKGA